MNQNQNKNAYYASFNTQIFLGVKELLKSMPAFYNKIYFSSKYANALWSGDKEEYFSNITLLTEEENIAQLRQIIKSNFLYIGDWDSLRFTDGGDFGFSFIGGNVKFIVMSFKETDGGYKIKSYDADTGDCYETDISVDKKFFLDVSMNENGEFVRTCDFNLEYINDANTKKERAPKKAQPEMIMYNRGYAMTNLYVIMLIALLALTSIWLAYSVFKISTLN